MSMEQQAAAQVSQVVKVSCLPPPPCQRSASPDPSKLSSPATSGLDSDEYLSVLWEQLKTDAKKSLGVEEVGAPFTNSCASTTPSQDYACTKCFIQPLR